MKINEDCVRDILNYLVDNLSIHISNNKAYFKELSMLNIIENFKDKYSQEDIGYSIYNLCMDNYIETNDFLKQSRNGFAFVSIFNVTHKGHEFYESIKPETIWIKTKGILGKVGIHTLSFIESITHNIAVESAKALIIQQ